MENEGPIIILDDDHDDLDLVSEAHGELKIKYPLLLIDEPDKLITTLHVMPRPPFLILSDYNLPKMNGVDLRKKILAETDSKYASIPYLIWSTAATDTQVKRVFDTYIHGFFKKPANYSELKELFSIIVRYWELSYQPKGGVS